MIYRFHDRPGAIPGVPGIFAHCVVEVDDATLVIKSITPLSPTLLSIDAVEQSQPSSPEADASPVISQE